MGSNRKRRKICDQRRYSQQNHRLHSVDLRFHRKPSFLLWKTGNRHYLVLHTRSAWRRLAYRPIFDPGHGPRGGPSICRWSQGLHHCLDSAHLSWIVRSSPFLHGKVDQCDCLPADRRAVGTGFSFRSVDIKRPGR